MDWKREAVEDLRQYRDRKKSLELLPQRMEALTQEAYSVRAGWGSEPVSGGTSKAEDRLIENIAQRERLRYHWKALAKLVELTERGLAGLSEEEKLVLEYFFINRQPYHVERLMERLGYEQRHIYHIKDRALRKFTRSMFGMEKS